MDSLNDIEPIKILAEIDRTGCIESIIALAKKFLPQDYCALVCGDNIHIEAIVAVYKAQNKQNIGKVEQICIECIFRAFCHFPRRS